MHRYSHVGSSRSHRGFVNLYVLKKLSVVVRGNSFTGVVVCSLLMNVAGGGVEHRMTLAAVHLPSGMAQAQVGARSRILVEIVTSCDDAGVLILGDTNCKDDEATDVCKKTDPGRLFTLAHRGDRGPTDMMPVLSMKVLASDMIECSLRAVSGLRHSSLLTGRCFLRVASSSCRIIFLLLGFSSVIQFFRSLVVRQLLWRELVDRVLSLCAIAGCLKSSWTVSSC